MAKPPPRTDRRRPGRQLRVSQSERKPTTLTITPLSANSKLMLWFAGADHHASTKTPAATALATVADLIHVSIAPPRHANSSRKDGKQKRTSGNGERQANSANPSGA